MFVEVDELNLPCLRALLPIVVERVAWLDAGGDKGGVCAKRIARWETIYTYTLTSMNLNSCMCRTMGSNSLSEETLDAGLLLNTQFSVRVEIESSISSTCTSNKRIHYVGGGDT